MAIPTNNLWGEWLLDEILSNTAADTSGNGHNGDVSGSWSLPVGRFGNALALDGYTSYVDLNATAMGSSVVGVSLWLYCDSAAASEQCVYCYGENVTDHALLIEVNGGNVMFGSYGGGSSTDSISFSYAGQWVHLVHSYDGTNRRAWINGTLVVDKTATLTFGSSYHMLGGLPGHGFLLAGTLDSVRVYNRGLTQTDVDALYAETVPGVTLPALNVVLDFPRPFTAPNYVLPVLDVTVGLDVPVVGGLSALPSLDVSIGATAPDCGVFAYLPELGIDVTVWTPSTVWSLPEKYLRTSQEIFLAKITGAADSLSDVFIPMSSCSMRLKTGALSYIAAVFPFDSDFIDLIAERPSGDLVVYKGFRTSDGDFVEEIARGAVETWRFDLGGNSGSITVAAYGDLTSPVSKERVISNVTYRSGGLGRASLRAPIDLFLRPGDSVVDGESTWVVGSISYTINAADAYMDVLGV